MLVVITNIPTPYRTAFFDTLASLCATKGVGFKVLYCAQSEPNRHWPFEPDKMNHDFEVLSGFHFSIKNIYPHINISVFKYLKALNPTTIICAGSWNMPTVMMTVCKRVCPAPIYFWSEGHADAVRNSTGFISRIRHAILNKFDGFLVPNEKSRSWITEQLKREKPCFSLPNTVNETYFLSAKNLDKALLRQRYNIKPNAKVFIQISQLEAKKGVLELANSFLKHISSAFSNSTLVFVGTGSLLKQLQKIAKQAPEHILIIGQQDITQIRDWLALSDWFVLNTNQDPNPLTPIEASFSGTPIILSKKAGNFNEICSAADGIEITDINQPEKALIEAKKLSDVQYRQACESALAVAKKSFTRQQVVQSLLKDLKVV